MTHLFSTTPHENPVRMHWSASRKMAKTLMRKTVMTTALILSTMTPAMTLAVPAPSFPWATALPDNSTTVSVSPTCRFTSKIKIPSFCVIVDVHKVTPQTQISFNQYQNMLTSVQKSAIFFIYRLHVDSEDRESMKPWPILDASGKPQVDNVTHGPLMVHPEALSASEVIVLSLGDKTLTFAQGTDTDSD